jgi:hypothetical protein
MAQIVFSEAGAVLGRRFLPGGIGFAGRVLSGAAAGRAAGNLLGRAIDSALQPAIEGPRVPGLPIMESREGTPLPLVYGRMRVPGQVIWASRFREKRQETRGGKGGPKTANFTYSVSLALALGEGTVSALRRVWANGEAFDLSGVTHRFYPGTDDQPADPLVEAIEGQGAAPAYRGTAYLVLEDFPLDAFGNRLPQFSFEIERSPASAAELRLADVVRAVNIIPASGEFAYSTQIIRERLAPGIERPLNVHSHEARADFAVSLDQLQAELPRVDRAALTVGWFGSSLDAATCEIYPACEERERETYPQAWTVAGLSRETARLVSRTAEGALNYGGTPSDASVIDAIREIRQRGLKVTLTPFLFLEAPGLPWRGRITAPDKSAAARTAIHTFVHRGEGYRRFILHLASLAQEAGGVDAFLIGSEMRGLTRIRDENGAFPFVEALVALATEVKAILPGAEISYAADWTEYGAYVPGDGSGDVLFPLDALWASPTISFVGVDWYPPVGDWREGNGHLDALEYPSADDPAYIAAQIEGGEAYDWYYADDAARTAQMRTPIVDTAHGEHWIFRAKDIRNWAALVHYPRQAGARAAEPTAWQPNMKPVRLCEIGFAAIDKAGNAPNVFVDPKSSESAKPPFSTGARDDVMQARLLSTVLQALGHQPHIESYHVWCWDARPFPAFPYQSEAWSDGSNWFTGHWLNGRTGLSPLAAIVADICLRAGISRFDVRALQGLCDGFAIDGVYSVRGALEPLQRAYGFDVIERAGVLTFVSPAAAAVPPRSGFRIAEPGWSHTRTDALPTGVQLRLTYIASTGDYQPAIAQARRENGDARAIRESALPLVLDEARAEAIAEDMLLRSEAGLSAEVSVLADALALEPGDHIQGIGGLDWTIDEITDAGLVRTLSLRQFRSALPPHRHAGAVSPPDLAMLTSAPDFAVLDLPRLPHEDSVRGPLAGAFSDPWLGRVTLSAGVSREALRERIELSEPAQIGYLQDSLGSGPVGRFDRSNTLIVRLASGALQSVTRDALFSGANAAALETRAGWEILQFESAELIAPSLWRLTGLLRGQQGTPSSAALPGARLVMLDGALLRAPVYEAEMGAALIWTTHGSDSAPDAAQIHTFENRASVPWPVAHLRVEQGEARWTRRGPDAPESWALPEAINAGSFRVWLTNAAGEISTFDIGDARCAVPPGTVSIRVAALDAAGREGPAVTVYT